MPQTDVGGSQRASGFARRPLEDYPTPSWLAAIFADWLKGEGVSVVWEPAAGEGRLAEALALEGLEVVATSDNFFAHRTMPDGVDTVCTNPPYGIQGRLAAASGGKKNPRRPASTDAAGHSTVRHRRPGARSAIPMPALP
jgi:hypothetical protein